MFPEARDRIITVRTVMSRPALAGHADPAKPAIPFPSDAGRSQQAIRRWHPSECQFNNRNIQKL